MIAQAAHDTVPKVAPLFWSFRAMVALGFVCWLLFGLSFWYSLKGNFAEKRWLLRWALWFIPMPWIAAELGWFVAEYGRQPWTIYGVLPTHLSVEPHASATCTARSPASSASTPCC
jgi:cytochrome bd ubiquinol oxidase subunit I